MKKIKFILPIILLLNSCGLVAYHANTYQMLKSDLTPHGNKVKREGENSFPMNGTGIVSLNFTTGKAGVNTLWRKINDDGTFSDRISLTYANPFKNGRLESMLEPGVYFLDGIGFDQLGKGYVREGAFLNIADQKQKGWDVTNKEPLWFSFEVKKGKEIFIPDIKVSAYCISSSNSCSGDDFKIIMDIKSEDKNSKFYKVGYKVNT